MLERGDNESFTFIQHLVRHDIAVHYAIVIVAVFTRGQDRSHADDLLFHSLDKLDLVLHRFLQTIMIALDELESTTSRLGPLNDQLQFTTLYRFNHFVR